MDQLLRDLLANFYSKPLSTLAALLIILIAFITYKSYDKIESLVITPKEEASRFHRALEQIDLVNTALVNLKETTNSSGVIIYQFHNGKHDLTGIPFNSALVTFSTDGYAADVPLSTLNSSLKATWTSLESPSCTIINKPVDVESTHVFERYSVKAQIVCPLVNPLNYPIGIIVANYSTQIDTKQVIAVSEVAVSVVGYLNNESN